MASTPEHQQDHETTELRVRVHQVESRLTAIRAIVQMDADEFRRADR